MNLGPLRIAREGLPYILSLMGISIIIGIFASFFALLPLVLALYVIYFFRDPIRQVPLDTLAILSAADGHVVGIEEITEPNYLQKSVKRVSIFLSIFDVHL